MRRGPCRRVWLCATEDQGDICYHHYHTCHLTDRHVIPCQSGSGPWHNSNNRVGEVVTSIVAVYDAMRALGWKP